jgi:hypothetical protein
MNDITPTIRLNPTLAIGEILNMVETCFTEEKTKAHDLVRLIGNLMLL